MKVRTAYRVWCDMVKTDTSLSRFGRFFLWAATIIVVPVIAVMFEE